MKKRSQTWKSLPLNVKKNEDNNTKVKSDLNRCDWKIWNFQVSKYNPEKYFCQTSSEKDNEQKIYGGSYMSGHFIFLKVFIMYMGMAAILVMWPGSFEHTFVPPSQRDPFEIWLWLAQYFLKRRCLKSVDDADEGLPNL